MGKGKKKKNRLKRKRIGDGGGGGGGGPALPPSLSPSERYFGCLLGSCPPSDLAGCNSSDDLRRRVLEEMCGRVGLDPPPPSPPEATYRDASHFYSSRASLVLEESRFVLSEALAGLQENLPWHTVNTCAAPPPSRGFVPVRLVDVQPRRKTGFSVLTFERGGGAGAEAAYGHSYRGSGGGRGAPPPSFTPREVYDMRPGGCFLVTPPRERREETTTTCSSSSSSSSFSGIAGGSNNDACDRSLLASVVPQFNYRASTDSVGAISSVSLMVYRALPPSLQRGKSLTLRGGGEDGWTLLSLGSVIGLIRQFEACTREERVPPFPARSRQRASGLETVPHGWPSC